MLAITGAALINVQAGTQAQAWTWGRPRGGPCGHSSSRPVSGPPRATHPSWVPAASVAIRKKGTVMPLHSFKACRKSAFGRVLRRAEASLPALHGERSLQMNLVNTIAKEPLM